MHKIQRKQLRPKYVYTRNKNLSPLRAHRYLGPFINKFSMGGKRSIATRLVLGGVASLRWLIRSPKLARLKAVLFKQLSLQITVLHRRRGQKYETVPTPLKRLSGDSAVFQNIKNAVGKQTGRYFVQRFVEEAASALLQPRSSRLVIDREAALSSAYEARTSIHLRWK